MTIERKIREHLRKEAETLDCPQAITNRIEQSYTQYLQRQRSGKTMKKRFIAGIVATAILIPTAAFAAPTLIEMLTRTPMTAEQVKTDEIGKATLEKLYRAFPETKKFEIIDASTVQGVQTSIILQEKGGTGKKIALHTNSVTGEIEHVIQENWEPKEKPLTALTEQEIKSKADHLIHGLYGSIEAYEFAMEPMENPDQKTLMLNYTQKGSTAPFYQVLVQDHSISLSLIGSETSSSDDIVEGFFTTDGKPDYFADAFLNDDKLFSLLNMGPIELKQELAKGKSVVEIAASKNVSKQQVVDVIAQSQVDLQIQSEANGETPANNLSNDQMLKAIEPKVLQVIEYKSVTPSKK
ncbi:hypothetical protein [Paenibacillus sp. BR1-192]|uniref:hypothetical protein n=1 Tax=Paenibacillus sp. BR1-192 TaxID=3032287 RepID=UPI00240D83D4|nr:hypothetical protein [Paenibacillus sp. BR1-192]WFB61490.1 hypothetical protein P0X86_15295 [Paenibacillus sp. BR1-192]